MGLTHLIEWVGECTGELLPIALDCFWLGLRRVRGVAQLVCDMRKPWLRGRFIVPLGRLHDEDKCDRYGAQSESVHHCRGVVVCQLG